MKTEKYKKKIAIIQTRNKILLEFWKKRRSGGIEPLGVYSPTDLKSALDTSQDQPCTVLGIVYFFYINTMLKEKMNGLLPFHDYFVLLNSFFHIFIDFTILSLILYL